MSSLCQSCAAPLESEIDFGTNSDGSKNREYCQHCYRNGEFTNPKATISEVMEISTRHMIIKKNMDPGTARRYMESVLPRLKRWRK